MGNTKEKKFFYGWIVAIALFLVTFLPMTFINTFFSYYQVPICTDFDISYAQFNIANVCSSLGAMLFSLLLSSKVTKGNIRLWMLIGGIIAAAAYFGMGWTTMVWQIYILVFVALFFVSAITYVPINFLISQWFVDRKGIVTSVVFAGTGVGGVVFSTLEASIIASRGWRQGFMVTALIILVIAIIVALLVRKSPADMGLSPYTSAKKKEGTAKKTAVAGEGQTKAEAVKSPAFWFYAISMLCIGMASAGIITQLPTYLTENDVAYAVVMAVVSAAMIIGKLILGPIIDKAGIFIGIVFACVCGLVGLVVLMMVPGVGAGPAFAAAILIPIGTSLASVAPPLLTSNLFGYKDFGGIYGLGNTVFMIGCMVGPMLSSGICTALGSYAMAWIVFIVIFILVSLFALFAIKARPKTVTAE